MPLPDAVQQKLESLPPEPGVYMFRDKKGAVLYVGKAKSLRSRVRSYFQAGGSDERYFIPILQRTVADLETLVTGNEKEAAILESALIKQHQPRYNVKLRDDKSFILLRLNMKHEWPRLDVVRDHNAPKEDGARYFGPFHSATAARRTLHLVNKHFQLRTCGDVELASRRRPCLQYQIKRCPAPCVMHVDRAWYAEQVRNVAMFLDGRHDELSRELERKMKDSARDMRFELAAVYRDQLRAIEAVRADQRVVSEDVVDRDVVGLYREGDLAELALVCIRGGRVADVATYSLKHAELPDDELVGGFLTGHYAASEAEGADAQASPLAGAAILPPEIVVPVMPEGADGFAEWVSDRAARKVAVVVPRRGPRVRLLELARDNARHAFAEKSRTTDDVQDRLEQLKERLRLPALPRRIECCDISHLGGGDTVGAIVAMRDGVLDKKHYRTFNIRGEALVGKSPGHVNDDYASMYEVLARRFRRGVKAAAAAPAVAERLLAERMPDSVDTARDGDAADADWDLPDLFVVDGGRGQLGVALAAAHDLGLHDLPIVALAKERPPPAPPKLHLVAPTPPAGAGPGADSASTAEPQPEHEPEPEPAAPETKPGKGRGRPKAEKNPEGLVDRVYLPGQKNPIPLSSHSASLFFLARVRDEAHRFSNYARERRGKARTFKSALDDVPGIGPVIKRSLLRTLGSVAAIKQASDEQLLAVPGVRKKHLDALRKALT